MSGSLSLRSRSGRRILGGRPARPSSAGVHRQRLQRRQHRGNHRALLSLARYRQDSRARPQLWQRLKLHVVRPTSGDRRADDGIAKPCGDKAKSGVDFDRFVAGARLGKELRRANDILKTASAFFAQAELDRRLKS